MNGVLLALLLVGFLCQFSTALKCGFGYYDVEMDEAGHKVMSIPCENNGSCAKVTTPTVLFMQSDFEFCATKQLRQSLTSGANYSISFCDTDNCNTYDEFAGNLPMGPTQPTAISCFTGFAVGGRMSYGGNVDCFGTCISVRTMWSIEGYTDLTPVTTYACAPADFCSYNKLAKGCRYLDPWELHTGCCCDEENCNDPQPKSVCPDKWKRSSVSPKCYYLINDTAGVFQSNVKCQEVNQLSRLASISNAFENSEVADFFQGSPSFRIGLSRTSNSWEWDNGSSLNYTAWANGQPSLFGGSSVRVDQASRKWYAESDFTQLPFLCELLLK